MIVVSDSSPLNYLVLIEEIRILPTLFGQVIIPAAVASELQNPHTPAAVAAWLVSRPDWLIVQTPTIHEFDNDLAKLGAGEREAILLASEQPGEALLLIDEGKGRRAASRRQIRFIGLLGILEVAAARNLLDLPETVAKLTRTTFYVAPDLLRTLLERHAQSKRPQ
jgi:predicted nucleic acid-binding protein